MVSISELFAAWLEQNRDKLTGKNFDIYTEFKNWLMAEYELGLWPHSLNPEIFPAVTKFFRGNVERITRSELYALFDRKPDTAIPGHFHYCCLKWIAPSIDHLSLKGPKELQRYLRRLQKKYQATLTEPA